MWGLKKRGKKRKSKTIIKKRHRPHLGAGGCNKLIWANHSFSLDTSYRLSHQIWQQFCDAGSTPSGTHRYAHLKFPLAFLFHSSVGSVPVEGIHLRKELDPRYFFFLRLFVANYFFAILFLMYTLLLDCGAIAAVKFPYPARLDCGWVAVRTCSLFPQSSVRLRHRASFRLHYRTAATDLYSSYFPALSLD